MGPVQALIPPLLRQFDHTLGMASDVGTGRHQAPVGWVADHVPVEVGLRLYRSSVVPCECGREGGFRIDAAPGWVWHTGPVILAEGRKRPLYIIAHGEFHGAVDPEADVDVRQGQVRVSLPPLVGKHRADNLGLPLESGYVVADDPGLPAGSLSLLRDDFGVGVHDRWDFYMNPYRTRRFIVAVDGTVETDTP